MKKTFLFAFALTIFSCSEDPVIHTLFTSSNPINGGSVSPSKADFENGESAEITALASSEYVFQNWTGASGSEPSTSVVMDMDKLVTANFIKKKYALNNEVIGQGTVTEKLKSCEIYC
ncbi:MAG: InlB B-repeat-containing protein [Flavobacteriales bacterium]